MDAKTPLGEQVFKVSPDQFFDRLCELLANNPPREADAPVMARIAKLSIKPGAKFETAAFDADTCKAIEEGVGATQKAILDQDPKMGKVVNNWVINLDTDRYSNNYLNHAAPNVLLHWCEPTRGSGVSRHHEGDRGGESTDRR